MAISYGVADGDNSVECVRIANWNTKDLITLERSFDPSAISDGIEDVTLRITHQDMMGDSIQAPFDVNENPVLVPAMMFALTKGSLTAPYVQVPQGESSVMLTPDPEDCYLNNQAVLVHLLQMTQLSIFLELYHDFDLDPADVISAGAN